MYSYKFNGLGRVGSSPKSQRGLRRYKLFSGVLAPLEEVATASWITVLDQSGGLVAISTKIYKILVYLYIVFRIWF